MAMILRNTLIAFIMLTQLDGGPVWIDTAHIAAIRQRSGSCGEGTNAMVALAQQYFCVKETPQQVREKIKAATGSNGGKK